MIHPKFRVLFVCLLTSQLLACDTPSEDQNAAIEIVAQEWIEKFTSGDLDALMTLYEPDAFVALHGQPSLRGVAEIREYFSSRIGSPGIRFDLDIEQIEIHGDVAHLISKYWFELPIEGRDPYRDTGRSLLIYKKSDGHNWRIYVDIDQATPDVSWPKP